MRSWCLRNKPTLQQLLEVQEHFGLPSPALVEKDWYVVQALTAIIPADIAPFHLVFGGGTALGRAHRLIRRMSEDIDLKIVGEREPTRPDLRKIRERVTGALLEAGFKFDPDNPDHRISRNNTRYTLYNLPYEPLNRGDGILRPEIKIETAVWPLRQPAVTLQVSSFIAEAYNQPPELVPIRCVTITQTAAEKFVALTRRVAAEKGLAAAERDHTLLRHIYDLHVIREHYDHTEVAVMARGIMAHYAEEFGNRSPAYREDCLGETRSAIEALRADASYSAQYARFGRDMVFGDIIDYEPALNTIQQIASKLPA
jgi:predicted nucleotidyltransferase component of viral defense system